MRNINVREKHRLVASSMCLEWGSYSFEPVGHKQLCPDWELNPQPKHVP